MVMDRLLLKKRSLTSSLSKLTNNTKRESRPLRCILVFTAFEMKMMSSDKEVRNQMAVISFQFSYKWSCCPVPYTYDTAFWIRSVMYL